jgi:hypothetical protein
VSNVGHRHLKLRIRLPRHVNNLTYKFFQTGSHPWRAPPPQPLSLMGLAQLVRATSMVPTYRLEDICLPL